MRKIIFGLVLTFLLVLAVPVAAEVFNFIDLFPAEDVQEEYIYNDGYEGAEVSIRYMPIMENFEAKIRANGLKPGFTYQVKLVATPTCEDPINGDDDVNELIGLAGRWYCSDCDGTGASLNREDWQYYENLLLPKEEQECISGYLVFDFFTADDRGMARTDVVSDASYHVLWCGGDAINNTYLYPADTTLFDCDEEDLKCDIPLLCEGENVIGQIERPDFYQLPEGEYKGLKIALTEESFHQICGTWATVLWNNIGFTIER